MNRTVGSVTPIVLFVTAFSFAQTKNALQQTPVTKPSQSGITLGQFRKKYLNQQIIILRGNDIMGSLGGWQPMTQTRPGTYEYDIHKGAAFIGFQYKDQTPTVISVKEMVIPGFNDAKAAKLNALGEPISSDDLENPNVEVVVRFDDGQLASKFDYAESFEDDYPSLENEYRDSFDREFMLVSERDAHAQIAADALSGVIGSKVFAVDSSLVLGTDTTAPEILEIGDRTLHQLHNVPLLEAMTIVTAKYNERYDLIVWKLHLSDGRDVLSASRYRDANVSPNGNDNSFLGRSVGSLLLNIPAGLTPHELAAIRDHKIFRGMSRRAVLFSWGRPNRENDYGDGRQWIYGDHQLVYLDAEGKVTNWQTLGQ